MTLYPCPRGDLACHDAFLTTGDLDYHLHLAHGYRGMWRILSSLRPEKALPVGPRPARHVPDGLDGLDGFDAAPGAPAMGTRPSATRAAVAARASTPPSAPVDGRGDAPGRGGDLAPRGTRDKDHAPGRHGRHARRNRGRHPEHAVR